MHVADAVEVRSDHDEFRGLATAVDSCRFDDARHVSSLEPTVGELVEE